MHHLATHPTDLFDDTEPFLEGVSVFQWCLNARWQSTPLESIGLIVLQDLLGVRTIETAIIFLCTGHNLLVFYVQGADLYAQGIDSYAQGMDFYASGPFLIADSSVCCCLRRLSNF